MKVKYIDNETGEVREVEANGVSDLEINMESHTVRVRRGSEKFTADANTELQDGDLITSVPNKVDNG